MSERFVAHVESSLEDLIPRYLQRRTDDVAAIREAVAAGDLATAQSLGHSMKGSGGGYGFDHVTEYGGRIERSADDGDADDVLAVTDLLETYLATVEIVIVDEEE